MPINHPNYISGEEFKRWMDEQADFRSRLEVRMDRNAGAVQVGLDKIESHLAILNGRVGKNAEHIAVIERDIDSIRQEDVEINKKLEHIQEKGCQRYAAHATTLGVLEGAGYNTDSNDDVRHQFRFPALTNKQKAVAGAGVAALLMPTLSELFRLLSVVVSSAGTFFSH